ncbi:MAG: hypothetical protein U9O95_02365 [Candidatus Marinimicrobia bacterium]|nr:hypothetical protein [Candidatus Neomarinimicrobiota bacterium]
MTRSQKIFITILLFFLMLPLHAGTGNEKLIIKPGQTVYALRHQLIVVDSIFIDHNISYIIDDLHGRLILLQSPGEQDTINIFYRFSEISAPRKKDLGIGKIGGWFPKETESKSVSSSELSNIKTRGSVSRQLEVGSSGQSLLSGGLDIKINGELSPGIHIKGIISDNDAPFQDYSSTQSVQDVDNILIQIYSDQFNAQIGDVYINNKWNHWSRFNRKLIGAQVNYKDEQYQGAAFVGSAKGKFNRQEIIARDGDQGPYRLRGGDGDNAITIVPQSEKVYVDGVAIDKTKYTLYYTDAELFFSPEFMVSASSRIVIEFNYVNEFYSRSSMGATSSWRFGKNFKLGASYIREKDDENNPIDIHLSNIPPDSLAGITSNNGFFIISTAIKDTAGDYTLSGDTWVYAGEDQGTHTVYFYRENQNGGYVRNYTTDGKMFFIYFPDDPLSQYFPRRKITLPATQWIGSLNLELGQKDKAFAFLEGAYSSFNANNYDTGRAKASPAIKWESALPLGKHFSLRSNGWIMNKDFNSFGKITRPDFERYLGFGSDDTITQMATITAQVKHQNINSNTSLEYIADVDQNSRVRLLADGEGKLKGASLKYKWSHLLDNGFLPYYSVNASTNIPIGKSLAFYASWMQDHFQPIFSSSLAYRAESAKAGMSIGKWKFDYTYRKDYDWDTQDSSFLSYSQKHDAAIRFDQSFFDNKLRWNTIATYRYDQRNSGDEQYLLTNSQLRFNMKKLGLGGSLKTAINRTSETKREAVFIFVGDGLGYYRLDEFGQYVPDDMGNFILSSELTNERQDQYVSKFATSLKWKKKWKDVKLHFIHNGSTDYRTPGLVLYAPLLINDPDTNIFYGNLRLKHEAGITGPDGKHRITLLFEDTRSQNFQTAYNENIYFQSARWLKYRYKPKKVILDIYYKYHSREQHRLPLNSYRVQTLSQGAGLECEYLFSKKLRATLEGKYEHITTNFNGNFITHWIELKSNWIWYRVAGERMFLTASIDRVISDHTGSLPYETANGLPVGWTWSGALRYEKRINQFISAGGFFQYRKRAEQKGIITANLEVKAYF